ncbi:TniQ family protein [Duganella sp. sic0402]|uniref:TniQ family protein n=1 Tax=Duganella sp. sic0402 TaxID=2854786 RepID=UPI001C45F16E|nr:TniQ family protein [Duganella sp. sic0402]MBV7539405.1 TniQ family protein [Duganella sp. sic0402]
MNVRNPIQALLVRPSRFADEGMNGYLLRLSEANGLAGIAQLWPTRQRSIDVLYQRLGSQQWPGNVTNLDEILPQFSVETGPRPLWNRRFSRYCPCCLSEGSQWRWEWELTLVTSCPLHEVLLVDECSHCNTKLNWKRRSLTSCDCATGLASATATQATKHECELSKLFAMKLREAESGPEHLQLLSIAQLNKVVFMLGAYAVNGGRKFSQKVSNLPDMQIAHPLVLAAAEILIEWPGSFFKLLGSLRKAGEISVNDQRLSKRFGFFYQYLYKELKEPEYTFLHQGFEAYVARTWRGSLAERNSRLSVDLRRRHVWVPINAMANELNTTKRKLQLLIDQRTIDAHVTTTQLGRKVTCVSREQIAAMRSALENVVDLKNACQMLGLKKSRMAQLLHGKAIGSIFKPKEGKISRWGIPKENLGSVLGLAQDLPHVSEEGRPELVSLDYALRYWLHEPFLFPALIVAIFLGEILPVAVSNVDCQLPTWLFDRTKLVAWIAERRRSHRQDLLTIPETARRLRIRQQAVYHLTLTGRIAWTNHTELAHPLVSEKALVDFTDQYVLCHEIRETYGWLPGYIVRSLKDLKIYPISGPGIDAGHVYLYERNSMIDAALRQISVDCELRKAKRRPAAVITSLIDTFTRTTQD